VTPRQRIALSKPCWRGWEVLDPDFGEILRAKGETWGTILSINR